MDINIFGYKIVINTFKNNKRKNKTHFQKYQFRFIILIIMFSIFVVSNLFVDIRNEYRIGMIAENNIIAYKDIDYKQNILDDKIKDKIIKNIIPEYDIIPNVEEEQIRAMNTLLEEITKLDINDDKKIQKYIYNNGLDLSIDDIKILAINKNIQYYVYLSGILSMIYQEGIVKYTDYGNILVKNKMVLDETENKLISNFIVPNKKINQEKTELKIEKELNKIEKSKIHISKGDIIVKEGEKISSNQYNILEELGLININDKIARTIGIVLLIVFTSIIIYILNINIVRKGIESKGYYPIMMTIIGLDLMYIFAFNTEHLIYLLPFTIVPIIVYMLTKDRIFTIIISTMNAIVIAPNSLWFVIIMILSLITIKLNKNIVSRNELVKNGIILGIIQVIFTLIYSISINLNIFVVIPHMLFSFLSGVITGLITLGLLPFYEDVFKILTDIKLLELGDFSNKLLKELLIKAPGTFHHSVMVGSLAENAAESIGANPILARVGAYYHDIGKIKRPACFVENQFDGISIHNELRPSLSALIILSHPKDGKIIGKQNGLPEEILDIIMQHHGTTMVQYFYYKAIESGEKVLEADFRYNGVKPQTKEAGIIMLADTIEAAIRASQDKSPEAIEEIIRYLVWYKIDDGQLNECNLNLKEIELIIKSFLTVIQGVYHERISYPKLNE